MLLTYLLVSLLLLGFASRRQLVTAFLFALCVLIIVIVCCVHEVPPRGGCHRTAAVAPLVSRGNGEEGKGWGGFSVGRAVTVRRLIDIPS